MVLVIVIPRRPYMGLLGSVAQAGRDRVSIDVVVVCLSHPAKLSVAAVRQQKERTVKEDVDDGVGRTWMTVWGGG